MVALAWQDFLARCYPSMLRPPGRLVLFLTVWAVYLADRLIDVRSPAVPDESARHRFYRRNTGMAQALLVAVLAVDAVAAVLWLRPAVFENGLLTTAAVIAYLAVFVLLRGGKRWKQISAAILFSAGVFLVAWTGNVHPYRSLVWPAVAFALLCLGNLILIETWEQGHSTPRTRVGMAALAVACLLGSEPWYKAVGLSAAALALLDLQRNRLTQDARRVLADAVLLTPMLGWWTLR